MDKDIDYDKLLDDWVDFIYEEKDLAEEKLTGIEVGKYTHGYLKGYQDGLIKAFAQFGFLETRKKRNYLIDGGNK